METSLTTPELAVRLFREGYNCAQAVFAAFAPALGMDQAAALRLTSALGGGLCRMRETCGAVMGAALVLGARFGGDTPDEAEKHAMYARGQAFFAPFKEAFGSYNCAELLRLIKDAPPSPAPSPRDAAYYAERPCARIVYALAEMTERALRQDAPETRQAP